MRSHRQFIRELVGTAVLAIILGSCANTASRPPQSFADTATAAAAPARADSMASAPAPAKTETDKGKETESGSAAKKQGATHENHEQNIDKSGRTASAEKLDKPTKPKTMPAPAPPPPIATEGSGASGHTVEEMSKSSYHEPVKGSPAPVAEPKATENSKTVVKKEQVVVAKHEVAAPLADTAKAAPADPAAGQAVPKGYTDTPTLAYHYPKTIKQGVPKFIFVHVNVKKPSQVSLELKRVIVNTIDNVQKEDTDVISTVQIKPYQYLTVSIEDPGKVFTISGSQEDRQLIDTVNGNDWKWSIVTNSDRSSAILQIHAVGERPGLQTKEKADDKIISIKIQLDRGFWRETVTYFRQNPGDFALKVVLPFFSFLAAVFWFIAKRKKGDDKEDGK